MREVVARQGRGVWAHRTVARQQQHRSQVAQPGQRVEIGREPPVRVSHDGAAAAEDRVAGEQGRLLARHDEGHRVGRVPRCRDHPHRQAGDIGERLTTSQRLRVDDQPRLDRGHRGTRHLLEQVGAFGVVGMAVGEQDQVHRTERRDGAEVRLVERTRVDDDGAGCSRRTQHIGVRALQRHRARVVGPHQRAPSGHLYVGSHALARTTDSIAVGPSGPSSTSSTSSPSRTARGIRGVTVMSASSTSSTVS